MGVVSCTVRGSPAYACASAAPGIIQPLSLGVHPARCRRLLQLHTANAVPVLSEARA
jgi:hypothetical protein